MPRVTIDTSEALSFAATEPGPYPMVVASAEFKKSKESGQNMMNLAYQFEDPAKDKECGKVFRNYMLEGKGAGFTREILKSIADIDIPVGGSFDFDSDELIGRHVIVQIGNREYEGKLQNEAERVISAS